MRHPRIAHALTDGVPVACASVASALAAVVSITGELAPLVCGMAGRSIIETAFRL